MRSVEERPVAIEEEVVRGLMMMLGQVFQVEEGTSLFYAPSSLKALQAQQQKLKNEGRSLTWPVMFVKLVGANRLTNNGAYNPRSLARHGLYVTADNKSREFARKLTPIRVDMEFEVQFMVDDQRKALRFVSDWMTLGLENRLNYSINYYGNGVDIITRLSDSLTVPEKEMSVDEAINVFEFSSTLVVEGWMTAQHVDNDSTIPLVRKVNLRTTPATGEEMADQRTLFAALKRTEP